MMQFRNILVHFDTRGDEPALMTQAIELARSQNAALKIVEIVPDLPRAMKSGKTVDYEEMRELLIEKKAAAVDALAEEARRQGIAATAKVLSGKTSVELIGEVVREKHDLVLKTAKGPESRRSGYLGTTATRLMRFCPCTVWAFRPPRSSGPPRVLAAVDIMPADERHARLNQEILEVAWSVARGKPHVVYAWAVYGERLIKDYMKRADFEALVEDAEEQTRSRMAELLRPFGMTADAPEVHLVRGSEDKEIPRLIEAQSFDVLVIGTVGRSGISGMMIGNTAEILLDTVSCSVVAVKPAEFISPLAP